jgi:hypothetical protein
MLSKTVLSEDIDDCSVDEMISKLNELKKQNPNEELHISYMSEYEFEGPSRFEVYFTRLETDEEYNSRLEFEKQWEKEKELKELDTLFGLSSLSELQKKRIAHLLEKHRNE